MIESSLLKIKSFPDIPLEIFELYQNLKEVIAMKKNMERRK